MEAQAAGTSSLLRRYPATYSGHPGVGLGPRLPNTDCLGQEGEPAVGQTPSQVPGTAGETAALGRSQ